MRTYVSRVNGPKSFKHFIHLTLTLVAVCCAVNAAYGQTSPDDTVSPLRGFQPTASYSLGGIETVNTVNGNLMLNVPLAVLPPGRGGHPGFQLRLRYNSKIWDGQPDLVPDPVSPNRTVRVVWLIPSEEGQGGWDYNLRGYEYIVENRNSSGASYPINDPRRWNIYKLRVRFPDGGTHEFRPYGHDDELDDGYYEVAPAPGRSYYSVDGTYARLDFVTGGWELHFGDGTRVVNKAGEYQRTYDRNGNYTEITSVENYNNTGHKAEIVTDQLGRRIVVERGTGEDYVHSTGFNGAPLTTTVKWGETYVTKTYRAGNHFQFDVEWTDHGVGVVKEIVLPSQAGGLKYTFGYNGWPTKDTGQVSVGWGELNSITLPSGARADYQYEMDNRSGGLIQTSWVLENSPKRKELNYDLEYDGVITAAPPEITTYAIRDGFGQVTAPDGGVTTHWGGSRSYKTQLPDGTVIERGWRENRPALPAGVTIHSSVHVNSFVGREYTSIPDATGALVKTAIKEYGYDKNGNATSVRYYDWVPYGSVPHDAPVPSTVPLLREEATAYYAATPDALDSTTFDPDTYIQPEAPGLRAAAAVSQVRAGAAVLSYAEYSYDSPTTTGNLLVQRTWDSTKGPLLDDPNDPVRLNAGNSVSVRREYDDNTANPALRYGNLTLAVDPNGNRTKYVYGAVTGPDEETFTGLYPTTVVTAEGASVQRTASSVYDFHSGLVTKATDEDNQVSTSTAYDALGRPTLVEEADGERDADDVSLERHTVMEYDDALRRVVVRSDLERTDDGKLVSVRHYDQLGRLRLSRTLEDASAPNAMEETAGVKVQTRYTYGGQNSYVLVSNPYRAATSAAAGSEATMGWSVATSDRAGRAVRAETFGGAGLPAPFASGSANANSTGAVGTAYDANTVTVTDQAGRKRRSVSDALRRLVRVDEPDKASGALDDASGNPVQPTAYAYDALGILRRVEQGGQQRFFLYDSLGRLIRAKNPEQGNMAADADFPLLTDSAFGNPGGQWSVGYVYDAAGNLRKRKDARGVVTTYGYDGLNRNTTLTYTTAGSGAASTPNVTHTYDGAVRGKGRLWVTEAAHTSRTTVEEYDAAGQVLRQSQQFWTGDWGTPYGVGYTYDLAGNVKTQEYPSGHSVSYVYDVAGRLSGFTGDLGGGAARTYADAFAYDPAGRVREERFGTQTPLYHKLHYNSRGQLFDIRLSTVAWAADQWDWNRGAIINYYSGNHVLEGDPATPASADNNGNLRRQQHWAPADGQSPSTFKQQTYEYDALNRLSSVAEAAGANGTAGPDTLRQAYDYDRWGNRTIDAAGTWLGQPSDPPSELVNEKQFDKADLPNTNRLYAPGDTALPAGQRLMRYDAAGNLVHDAHTGTGGRVYDAESRMTAAADNSGGTTHYAYDADGRRVRRNVGSPAEVWQVYGVGGELLAEYAKDALPNQPRKEYGYRGGELLVTAEAAAAGWGPPPTFTGPDPLAKGDQIKLEHLTDLRSAVNQLRQHAGLPAYNFTVDPDPQPKVTSVKAEHIRQLRAALGEARSRLGLSIGGYEHPTLTERVSVIYARDFQELRDQVRGAWQSGTGVADIRWLVTDQLGTPRMVADQTGGLAGVTRHDYLPFGEELSAGVGGRADTQGYSKVDNVRQKFTSKERDGETGLDYFGTRYYSPAMGRFTSPDIPFVGQWEQDPQSWNLYTYVGNNPLKYIDPTGMYKVLPDGTVVGEYDGECQESLGCWSEQNQLWELPNAQKGQENEPFYTFTDSVNDTPSVTGFVGPAPSVNVEAQVSAGGTRLGGFVRGVGRLFGGIGFILFNPIPSGCGASPGMVSDGNGGCRYDPTRDFRLTYTPPPQGDLPIFGAKRVRSKTQRARWVDDEGNIYEWDSQHGRVEKYNKRGKHLGEFDPNTGEQTKPAKPDRTTEP